MFPLKALVKEPQKTQFATFDIESRKWIFFVVAGFYNGEKYVEFRTMRSFINFLRKPTTLVPETIFAHFGGKFDFMFIMRELIKHKDIEIFDFIPRGSGILSFSIKFKKGPQYTFRDSSAFLGFSLKTLTETFDVPTKKGEWDHTKTKKWCPELSAYLKSDCIGLYQVIEKFSNMDLIKNAGLAYTMAGQSMRVFRSQFLKHEIMPHGINEEKLCRESYIGGRTEIFKPLCKQKIFCYDVNSLYPYVMRENVFPISGGLRTREYRKGFLGIYKCTVETPKEMHIPILGIIADNKLIFPLGKFKGVFTSAEIEYAKKLGYKIKVGRGYYFEESGPIFKEYIEHLYQARLNSEKGSAMNLIYKLLMNAHYGRYGLNPDKENLVFGSGIGSTPIEEIKTGEKIKVKRKINGKYKVRVCERVVEICKEPVTLNSFHKVGIASFVTSYARIHMHKLMSELGDDLYYTDTDSLWTTQKMKTSDELGGLKLESEHEDGAVFILPKTYIAKHGARTKIAMKGFPLDKVKNFTMEDFALYLEGESRLKTNLEPKFATFKQAIKNEKFLMLTKASTKEIRAQYNKRIIFKNKQGEYCTRPITIGEKNV